MPLSHHLSRALVLVGLGLGALGCGPSYTPPPEEPKVEPEPEPEPEPEKKPECKSLDEKCKATADTQAALARTDLVFIPPAGWLYAQGAEETVVLTPEGGGALAVTAFDAKDPRAKEAKEKRDATVSQLAEALSLKLPEKNKKRVSPNWDKPDGDVKVGEMTLQMWQFEGASREGKSGPVLFFSARHGEQTVLGLGFAPTGDTSDAEIMKALETIGPAPVEGESTK